MESWREVWRKGIAPLLEEEQLRSLLKGLVEDDPRLLQGATTSPPPLSCVSDWPCEGACGLAYAGATSLGGLLPIEPERRGPLRDWTYSTVEEVETFFSRFCFEIDQRIGEPAACRFFLTFWDDTPRDEMRREMIAEIQRELTRREVLLALAPNP